MKWHYISLFVIAAFVFSPPSSFAHGQGGEFKAEKAGYTIDVGYDPENVLANEPTNFNFILLRDDQEVDFTDIWVRIVYENQTILATGIHNQDLGGTTLLYQFPREGKYTLHVRYQNGKESLVESELPIVVLDSQIELTMENSKSNPDKKLLFIFGFVVAMVLGTIFGILVGRTTKLLR